MTSQERKHIGDTCYICLSSKAELVRSDGSLRIPLSVTEYKILSYFVDHVETPVYLEELARYVWGVHADEKDPNSLKSQISRVRGKLNKMREGLRNCIDTNYGLNSYTLKIPERNSSVTLSSSASASESQEQLVLSGIDLFEKEKYEERKLQ